MEGTGCQVIRNETKESVENELHDSGCERSPTTPSPPSTKYEMESSSETTDTDLKTYDRVCSCTSTCTNLFGYSRVWSCAPTYHTHYVAMTDYVDTFLTYVHALQFVIIPTHVLAILTYVLATRVCPCSSIYYHTNLHAYDEVCPCA